MPSCAAPSEGKSKIQVNLAITTAGAAAAATAEPAKATGQTEGLAEVWR